MNKTGNIDFFSVGTGINEENLSVQIDKHYIPALKHLSEFSHAIIIYRVNADSPIFQESVKTISIDEKTGLCFFEKLKITDDKIELIDIKPYFPCEDRVMDASYESLKSNDQITIITDNGASCGRVQKYRGNTYIKLNDQNLINVLGKCSHIKIFWWFNKFDKPVYHKATECNPPYENAPRTGIFASRSPVRPNPIALTVAKVKSVNIDNNTIQTSALDCFDNTPVIAIAPYNPFTDKKDNFFVPKWLEHWSPFWTEMNDPECELPEAGISPLEIIRKYQQPNIKKDMKIDLSNNNQEIRNHNSINVSGARQNNLKNISVSIPHNKITVVTGVSGSGKSSLVFDTVFAESQYRFFENANSVQHSGLKQAGRPDFDAISGLTPAIAVSQVNVSRNPRSTFGTVSGLYDLLRSLYAATGIRHCPECGEAVIPLSIDAIIETITNCKPETEFLIRPFGSEPCNCKAIVNEPCNYAPVKETVLDSLKRGHGAIEVTINNEESVVFQTTQMCYACSHSFFELTPAAFSFNNPESYCPVCKGAGETAEIDPSLIVTHPELSILDNASAFWGDLRKFRSSPNANWMKGEILALAQSMGTDLELPWSQLSEDFKTQAMFGSGGKEVTFRYRNTNGRTGEITRPVEGAVNILKRLLAEGSGNERILELYARTEICQACNGEQLNQEGRLVTVAGKRIAEVAAMPVSEIRQWVESLPGQIGNHEITLVKPILKELLRLCDNFTMAGLSYITLNRKTSTLSGGELQRTRLVTQLTSGISGVSYILDEPFMGLHRKDAEKLFSIIKDLKENGNTVIMVEHHRHTMLNADHIIDIGPGAGIFGGRLIAEGSPQSIMQNPDSITGQYLSCKKRVAIEKTHSPDFSTTVTLRGARSNNLKNVDISFPTGAIVCICGVSGSGKSSLVEDCLYPAIHGAITGTTPKEKQYESISGADVFSKIIFVDQKPIGRNSRSNPATYTGLMDEIRTVFASTPIAKEKGFKANRFSFNNKEGQCSECSGEGIKHLNLPFISDSEVECPICKGLQFNKETLEIEYNGKNIAEVLQMSVSDALIFFSKFAKAETILRTLKDIGLGYIKLGQNSSSVSGGEAQRIKLATELCSLVTGKALYILDEPSSGLHFDDVHNLMSVIHKITNGGNTVVMVEHNEDIVNNADVVIELGPEGGDKGGYVIKQEQRTVN